MDDLEFLIQLILDALHYPLIYQNQRSKLKKNQIKFLQNDNQKLKQVESQI
jgi:hypothetical protein